MLSGFVAKSRLQKVRASSVSSERVRCTPTTASADLKRTAPRAFVWKDLGRRPRIHT